MNQNELPAISRNRFLFFLLKCFAIPLFASSNIACRNGKKAPELRGLSEDRYFGFVSLQEVFLEGNPISEFDLGLALDQYMYGHPYPLETEGILLLLTSIPSSYLAALALDFSLTPLASLPKEERWHRLQSWKQSTWGVKRGLYGIFRQVCFFLLSSDKKFQQYVGYLK